MKKINKKLIFILIIIILILLIMLYGEIKITESYNKEIYEKAQEEYNKIISKKEYTKPENYDFEKIKETASKEKEEDKIVGIITIPKIKISYPIMKDYSEENLRVAPTKYVGVDPNERGNLVIVGHNYWNNKQFSNLKKLEIGDIIEVKNKYNMILNYRVYSKYEIDQYDFSCLDQNTNGRREVTLITCIKHKKNKRLIVKCVEE